MKTAVPHRGIRLKDRALTSSSTDRPFFSRGRPTHSWGFRRKGMRRAERTDNPLEIRYTPKPSSCKSGFSADVSQTAQPIPDDRFIIGGVVTDFGRLETSAGDQ
jgi:hypothetical protein